MIQELIVALIGILVFFLVLRRLYSFFFVKKEKQKLCGCSGCACSVSHKKVWKDLD